MKIYIWIICLGNISDYQRLYELLTNLRLWYVMLTLGFVKVTNGYVLMKNSCSDMYEKTHDGLPSVICVVGQQVMTLFF